MTNRGVEMVSVICCYNKAEEYAAMRKTLETQSVSWELIGVDNRSQRFSSAAAALNWGAEQAQGDILLFLHQDILFLQENSLKELLSGVYQAPGHVIVGLFGAKHGKEKRFFGDFQVYETLDECCVAMPKKTWEMLRFHETLCDGWHLYVVELCLRAQDAGVLICAKNCEIRHLSSGTVDKNYMRTYRKILSTYRNKRWIATTCKSMPTSLLYYYGYYAVWCVKKLLFGNYPLLYRIRMKK